MNICIVGSAPHSVHLAPYGSEDWVFWGCSPGVWGAGRTYGFIDRFDAWFELHRIESAAHFSPEYRNWLNTVDMPVYTTKSQPQMKKNIVLPVDELVKKFGPYFFNSTVSWMLALAIEAKPEKISLFGVDMAANEEYFSQKMGCIHFALEAQKRGIKVAAPYESDLFTPPPLYGVCEYNHAFIKMKVRKEELNQRMEEAKQRREQATQEEVFLKGALDDLSYCSQTWTGNMMARADAFNEPKQGEGELVPNNQIIANPGIATNPNWPTNIKELEEEVLREIKPKKITRKKGNGKADVSP